MSSRERREKKREEKTPSPRPPSANTHARTHTCALRERTRECRRRGIHSAREYTACFTRLVITNVSGFSAARSTAIPRQWAVEIIKLKVKTRNSALGQNSEAIVERGNECRWNGICINKRRNSNTYKCVRG